MHGNSRVSSAIKYDCFKLDDSGNCIIRNTWLYCIRFEKKFGLNEVILHCTRSVNCRLCLQQYNEYQAYEYSPMNKSINKVLADLRRCIANIPACNGSQHIIDFCAPFFPVI